jgi:anthranilate phosphoribosyltransferase
MRFAARARAELGVRTIFNMVGPLTNPAEVKRQVVGTHQRHVAANLSSALKRLKTGKACVVQSSEGLDEVGLSGVTTVFEVNGHDEVQNYDVTPSNFGMKEQPLSALCGGSPETNAAITTQVLNKGVGAPRDVVIANAAFGIYVSGRAPTIEEGAALAAESIDSGRALEKLHRLIEYTKKA